MWNSLPDPACEQADASKVQGMIYFYVLSAVLFALRPKTHTQKKKFFFSTLENINNCTVTIPGCWKRNK